MLKSTVWVAAFWALASAAMADPVAAPNPAPVPPAPAVAPTTPPKAEAKVCVTEQVTGSRLGAKKVCMTKSEFDERQFQARKSLDEQTHVRTAGNPL